MNTIEIYRDDSTTKVVIDNVKHYFWTADNTVLVIAQYTGAGEEHQYIHWLREKICWFRHIKHPIAIRSQKLRSKKPIF